VRPRLVITERILRRRKGLHKPVGKINKRTSWLVDQNASRGTRKRHECLCRCAQLVVLILAQITRGDWCIRPQSQWLGCNLKVKVVCRLTVTAHQNEMIFGGLAGLGRLRARTLARATGTNSAAFLRASCISGLQLEVQVASDSDGLCDNGRCDQRCGSYSVP
jgi:hypothetical protein